jgi:hypothetical protein
MEIINLMGERLKAAGKAAAPVAIALESRRVKVTAGSITQLIAWVRVAVEVGIDAEYAKDSPYNEAVVCRKPQTKRMMAANATGTAIQR